MTNELPEIVLLQVFRARGVTKDGRTETGGEDGGGKRERGTCQRDRQPRL